MITISAALSLKIISLFELKIISLSEYISKIEFLESPDSHAVERLQAQVLKHLTMFKHSNLIQEEKFGRLQVFHFKNKNVDALDLVGI